MVKSLENLTKKDPVVFWDVTEGLVVTKPTEIYENGIILVHYLYGGYKSTSQNLRPDEILAIGNNKNGKATIPGWEGKYDILKPTELREYLAKKI